MKQFTTTAKFFSITTLALLIYIWILQGCNGGGSNGDRMIFTTSSRMKVPKIFTIINPKEVIKYLPGQVFIDSIPYTDSNYCKQLAIDYYSRFIYSDTIKGDTADVYYYASINQNKADTLKIGYRVNIPFIKNGIIDYKPRNQLYLSGMIGTNGESFLAGPLLQFKLKNDFLINGAVDFSTSGDIYYKLGFGFKISFKKRPIKGIR